MITHLIPLFEYFMSDRNPVGESGCASAASAEGYLSFFSNTWTPFEAKVNVACRGHWGRGANDGRCVEVYRLVILAFVDSFLGTPWIFHIYVRLPPDK